MLRAAERAGAVPRGPVVFECVGVPGIIEQIVTGAPMRSRLVVVGVCMEPDTFRPTMASNKEIELRFAFCYDPAEFRETLHMVGGGRVNPSPLLTGTVGLGGVAHAFDVLGGAERHAKVLVDPASDVASLPAPTARPAGRVATRLWVRPAGTGTPQERPAGTANGSRATSQPDPRSRPATQGGPLVRG